MGIFYSNTLSARIKRRWSSIVHSLYLDETGDPSRALFVCGSARSGTTWLAEALNHDNTYRILHEPFTCNQVPLCSHFSQRQYLRSQDDDPAYFEPAHAIFSGRVRNAWIDSRNRCMFPQRRLIKDVRSTLMLKWIREHFPRMPIVFLVRHPCAVAASRVRLNYRTDLREVYFGQRELMVDHLIPFRNEIEGAQNPFERHVVDWCVENFVPFAQLKKHDVFLAFYENLCANPRVELRKLFAFLDKPFDEAALKRLHKPSSTNFMKRQQGYFAGDGVIDGWRRHVSVDEFSAAQRITQAFGLDQIYGDESLADAGKAENLLGRVPAQIS